MARGEDEAEDVVVDVLQGPVEAGLGEVGRPQLLRVADLLELVPEVHVPPDPVDGAATRRRGEPRARFVRESVAWPLLERLEEGVLGEVLRQPDVTDDPRDNGRHLGGLHPPDGLEGAADGVGVGVGVVVGVGVGVGDGRGGRGHPANAGTGR